MVLHGHPRFTADLDLVVALDEANILAALTALEGLGFSPRAPVPAQSFANAATREEWVRDTGLTVFSLWSPSFPGTEVDRFVTEPFDFDEAYARALHITLDEVAVSVASVDDLITMKRRAGRPKGLADIAALDQIRRWGSDA
ncbi:MAG: hypothetical protein AMXMBFR64_45010 [Myxococcales bacterium]